MKWKTLQKEQIFNTGFVTITKEKCEMPDGRIMPSYYVLQLPDWVNIVPITSAGEVVLIQQYRHATGLVHWEVPGGAVHRSEDAALGALRELEEETGYSSERLQLISQNYPNPALQDNKIYTYLALDCFEKGAQNLDPFEEIEVHKVSFAKFKEWALTGVFNHNIVVASVLQVLNYLEMNNISFATKETQKNL